MKRIFWIITIGSSIILSSCSDKNLMKYYYPINQEPEVMVYKYVNPKNQNLNEYWKITTDSVRGILVTASYDSKFNLYNTFEEKVNPQNAVLLKYIQYEKGWDAKAGNASVKKDQVYSSNKNETCTYKVEYTNKYGRIISEKRRRFIGFKTIEIQGKYYKTAKFKDEYFINAIDQNDKYDFHQVAYYAMGIGMVKYERFIPGEVRVLELEKTLTEKEFEDIKMKAGR